VRDQAKIKKMLESARAHVEQGGVGAAEVYYRMIAKDTENPSSGIERVAHGEACVFFARKELSKGRHGAACDWYQRALGADPRCAEYRVEYVLRACFPMAMWKNGRIEAERATRIDPKSKDAWRALGGVEAILGHVEEAIAAHDAQLALDPDDPDSRIDRAAVALDTADYATARRMLEPVLLTGRRADALHGIAMIASREGRHEEAEDLYAQAIAGGCHDPSLARWNRSIALQSVGRYREGWAEHEHRGIQKTDAAMALVYNRFKRPRLDRVDGPQMRVHVHQEMGHGDVIAMARYLPLLVERGHDVRLEVIDQMADLMRTSLRGVAIVPRALDYPGALGVPDFDVHVPMLSLPYLFGTEVDTVPWSGAYLRADPRMVETYRAMLPAGKRKVGLCWSSGIRTDGLWISEYGRRKSMPLETMSPVFERSGDCFVSLQVGPERKECREPVLDLLPRKPTWADTAALVECLDVVVTVDTSVAHLAGAMGKPVMLAMHTEGSWHWMTKRLDSPWYPTARLYRQTAIHAWGEVVRRIAADLRASSVSAAA